ncbi:MAG: ABC transporter ATP-binding protein [Clostridia bacterium]|nr:ABC transporter ATP-binding protein [Clostridia bacterium]
MSLLKVQNLSLGYEGKVIVSDISFTVNEGDFLSIIGENGTGKTTLVKGLLGLVSKHSGEIRLSEGVSQSHIGYLGQKNLVSKDFPASVYEIVMSGFLNSKRFGLFYTKKQKQEATALMERVGITKLRNRTFSELSGGQQQRVLLCRALCATTKLILLDEPTTGLDPIATSEFYSLLSELNKEGVTVIMVSHDVTGAIKMSSHIFYLGKTESFFGSTHQYLHSNVGKDIMLQGCPCDSCAHKEKEVKQNA